MRNKNSRNHLTIIDTANNAKNLQGLVYTWNGYVETEGIKSLFAYIDRNSDRLRKKFLSWVFDMGEMKVNGERVIDILQIRDGLSYWWLTLFAEKCPWKETAIKDIIRILALEEIIINNHIDQVFLITSDLNLFKTFKNNKCLSGVNFYPSLIKENNKKKGFKNILFDNSPFFLQGLMRLSYFLFFRWSLKKPKREWFSEKESIFFCSYFDNVSPNYAQKGIFHSYYWTRLSELLEINRVKSNWLHFFIPHDQTVGTPNQADELISRFDNNQLQKHFFIDSYLTIGNVCKTIVEWVRLILVSIRVRKIKNGFTTNILKISCWHFIRNNWYGSLQGWEALNNLLWLNLFEEAFAKAPYQSKGFYLCENQSWEIAFIYSWKKNNHGQLTAVPHSTNRRFWELHYFFDPRVFETSKNGYLFPDMIVLNSQAAVNEYLHMGYPIDRITKGEALRYNQIQVFKEKSIKDHSLNQREIRVLILSDFISSSTERMLSLLESSTTLLNIPVIFTIKPHPNLRVQSDMYPRLNLNEINRPISEIVASFDIAFSSNQTSAALDAYLGGLSVMVVLDEMELNMSPLRNVTNVYFVNTAADIAEVLNNIARRNVNKEDHEDFFFVDSHLEKWSNLIKSL